LDTLTISAVVIAVIVCGGFAVLGAWHARRRSTDADDFHVASGSTGTMLTATSLVALLAGTWVLFSPGEMASYTGIATLIGYAVGMAAVPLTFAFLGPALRQKYPQAPSVGLMARARWGVAAQGMVSVLALVYMAIYLAAELTAIAGAFQVVAGVTPWLTATLVAVATLSYAAWGGLRTTVFTDGVQFWFILPLLLLAALGTITAAGGWEVLQKPIAEGPMMDLTSRAGIESAVYLVVAILAANLFDQSVWQRVHASRDATTVRNGFLLAALGITPIILIAGWFGLWYTGLGLPAEGASTALFSVIAGRTPSWVALVVLALALVLVMSTLGSLANGMAAVVANDLTGQRPVSDPRRRLTIGRWATVTVAAFAIPVAAFQPSVTYVFLIADLLCATAVVPVFLGLLGMRLSLPGLFAAVGAGAIAGIPTFTRPDFFTPFVDVRPLLFLPADANAMLVSFALAFAASGIVALVATKVMPQR
jgi:Na+/proline symporter